jgi:hypothetical protein
VVHALSGVNQHGFASATASGALGELDGVAHGVNADFFAGFAFFVVNIGLRLLAQWSTELNHHSFGHQNAKVGMRPDVYGVATGAGVARAMLSRRVAQPSTNQR